MIKLFFYILSAAALVSSLSACSMVDTSRTIKKQPYGSEEPFRSGERTDYLTNKERFFKNNNETDYCRFHDKDGFVYEAPCDKP